MQIEPAGRIGPASNQYPFPIQQVLPGLASAAGPKSNLMAQKEVGKSVSAGRKTPVLSLRDVVVYPQMVIPLFVGSEHSVCALEESMNNAKQYILVMQKDHKIEEADTDN